MRKIFIIGTLLLSSLSAWTQAPTRQQGLDEIAKYTATVNRAAEQFLNQQLSDAERIKAVEPYGFLYDDKQKERFKGVALSEQESAAIRATALHKIFDVAETDERVTALAIGWLGNREADRVLRNTGFDFVSNLSFSRMQAPEVCQSLLDDPVVEFRPFAFVQLISHGDARAQQLIIAGLENEEKALLPPKTAISVLTYAVKKEYEPTAFNVFRKNPDASIRLEAMRLLGSYAPARDTLIAISKNSRADEESRLVALGALFGSDRENVVKYVMPLLSEKSTPDRIQATCIQMAMHVRQPMSYRVNAKKADALDKLIQQIAADRGGNAPNASSAANQYILTVRPRN